MRGLAAILILAVAAAGCTSGTESPGAGGDVGGDPPGGNETGNLTPPPPRINHRPLPTMDADPTVGEVPLVVQFRLAGADPDDDPLNWTLDVDSDGTPEYNGSALPAVVEHTFTRVAVHEVTYIVTDNLSQAQGLLEINVTPGLDAGPIPDPVVLNGSYTGVDPTSRCNFGLFGVGGEWHQYDLNLTGWQYVVTPPAGIKVNFVAADGSTYVAGTLGPQGQVPKDAAEVDICTDSPAGGGTYTFTATHPDWRG